MNLNSKKITWGWNKEVPWKINTWFFNALLNSISSWEKKVNFNEVKRLMIKLDNDSIMVPAKKSLLLQNFYDQLQIQNNKYKINQQKKWNFNFNQKQTFNSSNSKYDDWFYSMEQWAWNKAIVDFADYNFWWGTLWPNGFAQEEKMMLEGNFILESWKYYDLDKKPLYINGLSTHKFIWRGKEIYWNSKYWSKWKTIDKTEINRNNISDYFIKRNIPLKSNVIAMAAIKMKWNHINWKKFNYWKYYKENFEQMFNTAYSWFLAHKNNWWSEIHTWAWWTGVFWNSENATCVIQILAAQAVGIKLIYNSEDKKINWQTVKWDEAYNSAERFLKRHSWKKYNEIFNEIIKRGHPKNIDRKYWVPNNNN